MSDIVLDNNQNRILNSNGKKARVEWVDIAKGILLYTVVIGHSVIFDSESFRLIFAFHMPAFFFLSGYTLNFEKYPNFLKFFKAKFKQLIIPYFVVSLLGLVQAYFIPIVAMNRENLLANYKTHLLNMFYMAQPTHSYVGPSWFLVALFFASIFLYILEKLTKKLNVGLKLFVYTLVYFAGINIFTIYSKLINAGLIIKPDIFTRFPFKTDAALVATMFLALGLYVKKYRLLDNVKKQNVLISFLFMFAMLYICSLKLNNTYINLCDCTYGDPILYMLGAIGGILATCCFSILINKNKLLSYIGRYSLIFFLSHSLIHQVVIDTINKIFNTNFASMGMTNFQALIVGTVSFFVNVLFVILYIKIKQLIKKKTAKKEKING